MSEVTAPVEQPTRQAICRHCGKPIETLNRPDVIWVDADGFPNCQKHLRHEPMPDGMSGAPVPVGGF